MVDFSIPEVRALYVSEVHKRMEAPLFMSLEQAQMLVAALMTEPMMVSPATSPLSATHEG
jgi:hypothetical protein